MGKMVIDEADLPEAMHDAGVQNLIHGILKRVCKDYKKALRKLEKHPNSVAAKGEKIRCEVALRYWNIGDEEVKAIRDIFVRKQK